MSARKVVIASAAALALAGASVPVVNAGEGAGAGSLPISGLFGGGSEGGSLSDGSSDGGSGGGVGSAAGASGAPGSGGSGSDASSLSGLIPESGEICDLPELGGSIAKFYPLFGLSGIPTIAIDFVTGILDIFPNLIEIVAGEGAGAQLVAEAGSLDGSLCTLVFGGRMVPPPETVIVDPEGQPVSTVTGTVEPGSGSSGPLGSSGGRSTGEVAAAAVAAEPIDPLPTTVPVP